VLVLVLLVLLVLGWNAVLFLLPSTRPVGVTLAFGMVEKVLVVVMMLEVAVSAAELV